MKLSKLAAWGGIVGPLLFTAVWVISSQRQAGHAATEVQLSGLAADDARDPHLMTAAFVVLGACSIGFGAALRRIAGPKSAGPGLVMTAGAMAVAAGVFRRDHMLLTGPGFAGESWHNQVHDVVSGVAYAAMLAAPLELARRFRADPDWAGLSRPVQLLTLSSAAAMVLFASRAVEPWNGIVQRVAVTLAVAAEVVIAARMLAAPPAPPCCGKPTMPDHEKAVSSPSASLAIGRLVTVWWKDPDPPARMYLSPQVPHGATSGQQSLSACPRARAWPSAATGYRQRHCPDRDRSFWMATVGHGRARRPANLSCSERDPGTGSCGRDGQRWCHGRPVPGQ